MRVRFDIMGSTLAVEYQPIEQLDLIRLNHGDSAHYLKADEVNDLMFALARCREAMDRHIALRAKPDEKRASLES